MKLTPRRKKFRDEVAVLLSDGRIEWNGQFFASPSNAGKAITGLKAVNGWYFFLVDTDKKRSLKDVRIEYLESISADPDDDNDDDV